MRNFSDPKMTDEQTGRRRRGSGGVKAGAGLAETFAKWIEQGQRGVA
jgi:hypothetical protein